jgi:hypothetical protein
MQEGAVKEAGGPVLSINIPFQRAKVEGDTSESEASETSKSLEFAKLEVAWLSVNGEIRSNVLVGESLVLCVD